jgi:hypothetical protein
MRLLYAVLCCAALISTCAGEITEPDVIRNNYLRTEKTLWENVIKSPSQKRVDRLTSIFTDHNKFVETNLRNYLDIDDLKMLIKLNGWFNLESEIINVHRMFITFQQHLNREAKYVSRGEFNEDVSLDLTEHVLDDSNWPLMEAIENLNKVIVQEKLYLPQLSVSLKSFCSDQTINSCKIFLGTRENLMHHRTISTANALSTLQCHNNRSTRGLHDDAVLLHAS